MNNTPVKVAYGQQTFNARNPLVRYAHRSRAKKSLDLILDHLPMKGTIVDFGAGEGHILSLVNQRCPEATLYAVEFKEIQKPYIQQVSDLAELPQNSLDLVTSFEVCEHLYETEVEKLIADAHSILKPTGKFILSVPIMYGLTLLPKELNKMVMHRRGADYSLADLSDAVLGRPIPRPEDPRHTHKGFDFRWLQQKLEQKFEITQRLYSPFPQLPWGINSQCFWICQPLK